jgi:spermidine/putrescine-binding protein
MTDDDLSRRKFVKYAGVTGSAAALAGCGGDTSGGDTSGGDTSGDTLDSGERPIQWIGPAWAVTDEQAALFSEVTGIDQIDTTQAAIPTTQQRLLGGERESFDLWSLDTSGAGALVNENDAHVPIPTEDLDRWNEDSVSELFTAPGERLDFLGAQVNKVNELLWQDEEQTELRFPPHVYNFDAIGYNPEFVDEATLWTDLFDDQYEGQVCMGSTAAITIPEALMHLVDQEIVDGNVGDLNNPTEDQLDAAIDFLIDQKTSGQFRSTWQAFGESVNLMASEEAIIGDLWQPAALATRRSGTPVTYATMETGRNGLQGYRYWYGGIAASNPGSTARNNYAEAVELYDMHLGARFPAYTQGNGYSVPHYPNTDLVRDGSDDTGEGMGPEYYDWSYRGERTYEAVDEPALFDPLDYDWADEEGEPASDGAVRDSGPIEERIDRIGFFQVWPDNADYMTDRWRDFTSA